MMSQLNNYRTHCLYYDITHMHSPRGYWALDGGSIWHSWWYSESGSSSPWEYWSCPTSVSNIQCPHLPDNEGGVGREASDISLCWESCTLMDHDKVQRSYLHPTWLQSYSIIQGPLTGRPSLSVLSCSVNRWACMSNFNVCLPSLENNLVNFTILGSFAMGHTHTSDGCDDWLLCCVVGIEVSG